MAGILCNFGLKKGISIKKDGNGYINTLNFKKDFQLQ